MMSNSGAGMGAMAANSKLSGLGSKHAKMGYFGNLN
jgi:hypothetical protein